MSKLAHSNEETMQIIELRNRWEDKGGESEFFDELVDDGADSDIVGKALGSGVMNDYMQFIYLNYK